MMVEVFMMTKRNFYLLLLVLFSNCIPKVFVPPTFPFPSFHPVQFITEGEQIVELEYILQCCSV